MVRRPHTARFMPGVWVFPGGAVDGDDGHARWNTAGMDDWKVAAVRELIEETGLWITADGVADHGRDPSDVPDGVDFDGDVLIYFANWITPEVFPIRFDARFYLAVSHADVDGSVDGDELIDLAWVNPVEALRREAAGEWDVAFPTRVTLELLAREPDTASLEASTRALGAVPPVEPRLFVGEDEARIVLPEDPMFDDIAHAQHDPDLLDRLAEVVAHGGHVPAEFKDRS